MNRTAQVLAPLVLALAACHDNSLAASLTPVPPVHVVPVEVRGSTILVAEDPIIETRDPVHIQRAQEHDVPHQYRVAMVEALKLAGFRVTSDPTKPHDLVAKLALNVSEDGDHVKQTYRCGLRRPDGTPVAQIDWTWPEGTFVGEFEVFDFATHSLATEVAKSRKVLAELRRPHAEPEPPAPEMKAATPDAGAAEAPSNVTDASP